jgi:hypothetical protein
MKKVISILVVALFTLSSFSYASFSKSDIGTASAQFLKIGIGARGIGMAGAQTAVTDEVDSIYWNPAGLVNVKDRQASLMDYIWFQDINYQTAEYAQNTKYGVFGAMINYLSMDSIQKRDNIGTPEGDFNPNDMAITVSYAKEVKNIPVGANLKYISSKIDDVSANAVALDLGAQYKYDDRLGFGFVMQNLGTKMKYLSKSEKLPFTVKAGAVYDMPIKDKTVKLALDLDAPIDDQIYFAFGAEYKIKGLIKDELQLIPRIGYNTNTNDLNGTKNINLGTGFEYKGYRLDYAWSPYGELGDSHQISLLVKFDEAGLFIKKKNVEQVNNESSQQEDADKQAKQLAKEEAAKKKAEEKAAKKLAKEEANKKKAEEKTAKKLAKEEAAKKKAEEKAAAKQTEEEQKSQEQK